MQACANAAAERSGALEEELQQTRTEAELAAEAALMKVQEIQAASEAALEAAKTDAQAAVDAAKAETAALQVCYKACGGVAGKLACIYACSILNIVPHHKCEIAYDSSAELSRAGQCTPHSVMLTPELAVCGIQQRYQQCH